ncbi:ABC-type transport auxiliary lipoprotein family protein [Maritalea sp.]|uniref:ABC-type transport auxiliary lipoprotein family protein n=1 Tax=Maritalea sp. TaxID=2003361 RepID=UPI003EF1E49A
MKLQSRRLFLLSGAACLSLPVAGCTLAALPPETYDLTSATAQKVRRRSSRTVVITRPESVQTYDTERVVVRAPGGVLSYLPEAQWSDKLPLLIQTRLLQTFEDAAFPNVGRPNDQLSVDVTLATEIRAFEIDTTGSPSASVKLSAKLVNERRGSIFANSVFAATVPISSNVDTGAIVGLNSALNDVSLQILNWSAAKA